MARIYARLARANGWGFAGSCPGQLTPKTPAAGDLVYRVAAIEHPGSERLRMLGGTSAGVTLPRGGVA